MARARISRALSRRGDTPGDAAPEPTRAPSLEQIESQGDQSAPEPDPGAAVSRLEGAIPLDEPPAADAPSRPRRDHKAERARRKRERQGRPRIGRPTYADVIAERDALRAQLGGTAEQPGVSVEQLRDSLTGTFLTAGELVKDAGAPAWQLSPEQAARLGAAWAPVLAPYWDRLGAASPLLIAVVQTGMVLAPNFREHRRLAAVASATETTAIVEDVPDA